MNQGEKILLQLRNKGLTQQKLAELTGISRNSIGVYVKSKEVPFDNLKKICKALEMDIHQLIQTEPSTNIVSEPLQGYTRPGQENQNVFDELKAVVKEQKTVIGQQNTLIEHQNNLIKNLIKSQKD